MTKQILAFLFCFIRELNPYSPLGARTQNPPPPRALSLWQNRVKDSTNPLLPPYIHPKARGFIKPLVLTLTLRPPIVSRFEQKKFITTLNTL